KNKILDYGCGNGVLLIEALKENENARGFGIDISENAIFLAEKNVKENNLSDRANFRCGSVEILKTIKDNRYEAVILANILDSMTIMDSYILLDHLKKIVKDEGKIFVKVRPYKNKEELKSLGAVMLNDELFEMEEDNLLRNLTTEKWIDILKDYFEIKEEIDVSKDHDRIFLMVNKKTK
nr:class I SAM-dependent methyltransferase [Clostridium sp.]